jgi:2-keto-3-deoxy-L-rhamnonate aldolase RhmA
MPPAVRPNIMKAKLARGEVALGCSLMFPSPQLVEMVAYAGFDWVLIDCEHGSIGPADVELMCMAADASGITAIGRPKSNSAAEISALMDRGVSGVQVPHINTADDARRAVAAVKFGSGSDGRAGRGLAAGTRPDRWGLGAKMTDFVTAANAQSLVCVQIEHAAALPNVVEICAVDGIDVVFIGPSDLSQSMGYPGNPGAAAVADAIQATLAKIRASGMTPGMPATTDALPGVLASGSRYIYTHLPKLLGAGASAFLAAGKVA